MKGIEILTQKTIEHPFWNVGTFILIVLALIGIVMIIIPIKSSIQDYFIPKFKHQPTNVLRDAVFLGFILVFTGIALVFTSYITLEPYYYENCQPETQYLIKVSEDAEFLEFYNRYEILEDKGNNIFVVREIKEEGN